MGDNRVMITTRDFEEYLSCVDALKLRIGWRPYYPGVSSISEELQPLESFFWQYQTEASRKGILLLLNAINDYETYILFLDLCQELIQVEIEPETDFVEEGPYTFFYFLYKSPTQIPEIFKCAVSIYQYFQKNTHKVLNYLFCFGNYVTSYSPYSIDRRSVSDIKLFILFFIRRTENFLSGIKNIQCFLKQQPLKIELQTMIPTKGDMHCGGKLPYIVTYAQCPFVYKPRDMRTDFLITEALTFFCSFLEEEIRPPIFQIQLLENNTGLMEFAEDVTKMDEQQAESYFLKFGALLCFIQLFGIEDLHYENIMATQYGPVIIDLECSFDFNKLTHKSIMNEPLRMLREAFSIQKLDNATFFVGDSILPLSHWENSICRGFLMAAKSCQENKAKFMDYYGELLHKPFFRRIVPIATGDFYGYMYDTIWLPSDKLNRMLMAIYNQIKSHFISLGIPQQLLAEDNPEISLLIQSIYQSLFWGDVPFFQLYVMVDQNENLCYHIYANGEWFFKQTIVINTVKSFVKQFGEKINWLNTKEAESLLRAFING